MADAAIVYACSTNPGKLAEFQLAAREAGLRNLTLVPLPGLKQIQPPEENGATFEENAAEKAIYYSRFTGEIVLADDSGLEVDGLGGAPGVHSARYAGPHASDEENNRKLLRELDGIAQRRARFVCVLALAQAGRVLTTAHGAVQGEILTAPRGSGGFGYDPLFFYPPLGRSFGELSSEEKFAVSHRGNAVRSLFGQLACSNRTAGTLRTG